MMAELFAKETGYCRAKGGSMHVADLSKGILGAMGIVGGGIPMAGGAGLSAVMRGTDQVVVSFFGDGASNQGTFHETVNLASVWDLPVVFVCVNNLYALSTPKSSEMKIDDISVRAQAYGIPGVTVNGMDVLEVYEAGREAIRRARKGEGPTLVECKTYRYFGHHAGDPGVYRTKEELERYKDLDPIPSYRKKLVEMGVLTDKKADRIMAEAEAKIEESIEFAEASPDPLPEEALEDVFV
jgi:pyruvate dehydrogenase E1 component alpha subunit